VLKGDKKLGTDMHTINAKLIGCDRDTAKTFFYAMIYGSGDLNLGAVIGKNAAAGKAARERLMKGVPALGALVKAVHAKVAQRGYLVGLDGRHLKARAQNAALNTLLQSAGAVQMKRGLVILVDKLTEKGWEWGKDYAIVGLIHDEWQANVLPEKAEEYGETAAQSIRDAGTYYSFGCPLDGQYEVGDNWADTH
jgi:DNA polymerase I-like protein with 3'-5' exonuclease and polymerase domains